MHEPLQVSVWVPQLPHDELRVAPGEQTPPPAQVVQPLQPPHVQLPASQERVRDCEPRLQLPHERNWVSVSPGEQVAEESQLPQPDQAPHVQVSARQVRLRSWLPSPHSPHEREP